MDGASHCHNAIAIVRSDSTCGHFIHGHYITLSNNSISRVIYGHSSRHRGSRLDFVELGLLFFEFAMPKHVS